MIRILESIVRLLTVVRLIVCCVEGHQTTAVCYELTVIGIACSCVDAAVSVGYLLTVRVGHLVLAIIVTHVVRGSL